MSQLERFKSRLISERELQLATLQMTLSKEHDAEVRKLACNIFTMEADELDEVISKLELSYVSKFRKTLQAIDASLCQIEIGLYGFCADCEQAIEAELLKRDPTTQRCKRCNSLHHQHDTDNRRVLL
ncbi:TraR/DksA family transcriptional regulator [Echinimonas agarilytica]|uniref:Zinc finger DksA/TraR C4-type domain-containing protein n=1 Tax=Echinimonas agarilytica TaxID=1215918 RepID=A0AA41W7Q0_9GAMM|nr:TraR/DksA C4-type zinc finger protein [Echinimonas agarilytica]MCM2679829.1 hypothetical protein [Echinimonas agarilytica]